MRTAPPGFAARPAGGRGALPGEVGEGVPDGAGVDEEGLHRLWLQATADSIGRDLLKVRAMLRAAPAEHRPLLRYWVETMEQLELWLRHR